VRVLFAACRNGVANDPLRHRFCPSRREVKQRRVAFFALLRPQAIRARSLFRARAAGSAHTGTTSSATGLL